MSTSTAADSRPTPPSGNRPRGPRSTVTVRRFNGRFFLKILAAGAAFTAGLWLLHGRMVSRNAEDLLSRADAAERSGNLPDAVTYVSQYLGFRPDDVDARERYAVLLTRTADSVPLRNRAFGVYEDVLRRDPARAEARRRLVDLAMTLGRHQDARAHLDLLLARPDVSAPELTLLYARCEAAQNRPAAAAILYLRAIDLAPGRVEPYAELAGLIASRPDALVTRGALRREVSDWRSPAFPALFPEKEGDATAESVADAVTAEMVKRAEPRSEALLSRALFRRSRGRLAEAAGDVAEALELAPPDASRYLMAAAEIELARGREAVEDPSVARRHYAAAEALAERGVAASPPDPQFRLLLSEMAVRNAGDKPSEEVVAAAERHLRAGIEQATALRDALPATDIEGRDRLLEKRAQLRWGLTELLVARIAETSGAARRTARADAAGALRKLRDDRCREELADLIECRLLGHDGKWGEVASRLERLRVKLIPFPALLKQADLLLGESYGRLGNPDRQVEAFRRAKEADRLWPQARVELARSLTAVGRIEEAIAEYRSVLWVPGVPLAAARLTLLDETSRPAEGRRLDRVEELLNAAERDAAAGAEVAVLRAEVASVRGETEAAGGTLEAASQQYPDDVAVWRARVNFESQRADLDGDGRAARVEELVRAGDATFGDRPEVRLAKATLASLRGGEALRVAIETFAAVPETWPAEDRLRLYEGLLRLASRSGENDAAANLWDRVVSERPDSLPALLGAASFFLDSGDAAAAANVLAAIRRVEGENGPNGDYVDAILRLRGVAADAELRRDPSRLAAELKVPRTLLASVAERRPYWPAARRALGALEQIAKNERAAVEHYERAFALGDRSKEVVLTLVDHHRRNGQSTAVEAILRQVGSDSPSLISGELADVAWRVALERGRVDEAVGWAERLAADDGDVRDRLAHGDLLFATYRAIPADLRSGDEALGLLAQAKLTYESLVADAPDQPDAWFGYIAHLWRVGEKDAAKAAIAEAGRRLPDEPGHLKPLALGRYNEVVQDRAEASRHFRDAVASSPADPDLLMTAADFHLRNGELDEADAHLDRLLDRTTRAPGSAVTWARRRKALATAARGSYADVRRALAMLRESAEKNETSVDDLRVQVAILSPRTTYRDRVELIGIIERIGARGPLAAAEKFRLATLYDRTGQWAKAEPLFTELMQADRGEPAYVAEYVAAAIEHETRDAALEAALRPLLDRLSALEPAAARTAAARARVDAAFGAGADADAELRRFADRCLAADGPGGAAVTAQERVELRGVAELAEELGLHEAAEALYGVFAAHPGRPEDVLTLATYYGRRGLYGKGLDLCEEHASRCSAEAIAITAVNVVSLGRVDSTDLARANRILDAAIETAPMSPRLLAALAGLRTAQGRYDDAESVYRALLAERPENVPVLNNLAWLLVVTGRDASEALELVERAIAVSGPGSELLDTRGLVWLAKGLPEKAVPDFEAAVLDTPAGTVRIHLASAYDRVGRTSDARQAILAARKAGLTHHQIPEPERPEYERLTTKLEIASAR